MVSTLCFFGFLGWVFFLCDKIGKRFKMDVQKITVTMLMLVALYLILKNAEAFNGIISGVGNLYTSQIAVLQGR